MSVRVEGLWACGVHTPETAGVVCGVCHETALRRAREEGRAEAKEENTRLREENAQAEAEWAEKLGKARSEALAARRENTPLAARVAALEKQLAERKEVLREALRERIDATRASLHLDMRAKSLRAYALEQALALVEEFWPTPPPSAPQSDNTPIRKPEGQP